MFNSTYLTITTTPSSSCLLSLTLQGAHVIPFDGKNPTPFSLVSVFGFPFLFLFLFTFSFLSSSAATINPTYLPYLPRRKGTTLIIEPKTRFSLRKCAGRPKTPRRSLVLVRHSALTAGISPLSRAGMRERERERLELVRPAESTNG